MKSKTLTLLAVSALLGLTGLIALFAMAPYSSAAMDQAIRVSVYARGVVRFPELAGHRNQKCSLGDALAQATTPADALAKEHFTRDSKVLAHDGALDLVATPAGEFWIPRRDFPTFMDELAEQADDDYQLAARVHKGDVALDCGANVGTVTRRLLALGAGKVVAVEPGPEPLECLRRNFKSEIAAGRVILYPKGVWDKEDQLVLTTSDSLASTAASVALDRGSNGAIIKLTTIDRMVEELGLPRVDFIKMDIEGAEPNALRGAAQTLAKYRPRLSIALEHRPIDPDELPALVEKLQPNYRTACGPCANINGNLQPKVLFAE